MTEASEPAISLTSMSSTRGRWLIGFLTITLVVTAMTVLPGFGYKRPEIGTNHVGYIFIVREREKWWPLGERLRVERVRQDDRNWWALCEHSDEYWLLNGRNGESGGTRVSLGR